MAVYDLEEQEKIDELKAWWRSYGTLIVIGLAVFVSRYRRHAGMEVLPEPKGGAGSGTI